MGSYLELALQLTNVQILLLSVYLLIANSIYAQQADETTWNGNWIGEGTIFEIRVAVTNGIMQIHQIESMGFIWTSKDGTVEENIARVEVEYAGATGIIQAELVDKETAVAFAASCDPDFMVVCVLAKNQQAIFKKIDSD